MSENKLNNKIYLLDNIIEEICSNYDYITPDKIQFISPVYYPIANIELEMQERTFEDFEPAQLAILKLMNIGYKNYNIIANLLGLNASFVRKIQKLLFGYQLIDSYNNVTQIGKESVIASKKIQLFNSKQVFQLDPLNCSLIKLNEVLINDKMKNKESLYGQIVIIDYADNIDSDVLISNISEDNFRNILSQKEGVLNTNIERINNIICKEVVYTKAYCLKIKDIKEMLIFAKREDFTKKKYSERYRWIPFAINSVRTSQKLGLNMYTMANENSQKYINDLFRELQFYSHSIKFDRVIDKMIPDILDCHFLNLKYVTYNRDTHSILINNAFAFSEFNIKVLKDLYQLAKYGIIVTSVDSFTGNIIRIYSKNERLITAAKKVVKLVESQNGNNQSENIKSAFLLLKSVKDSNDNLTVVEIIEKYE